MMAKASMAGHSAGMMTSLPRTSIATSDACSAEVPELTAMAYSEPISLANLRSNSATGSFAILSLFPLHSAEPIDLVHVGICHEQFIDGPPRGHVAADNALDRGYEPVVLLVVECQ